MADCFPPTGTKALAAAQPRFSAYRLQEIRDWSASTDTYAPFLRATVPLQQRIAPFAETQADPTLDGRAEVMLMQADYGNAFFNTAMANDDFCNHTLSFWQYVDYFSPWHGAATASTPAALYDPAHSDWRNRGFEFGIVNIPNPAYTNAAHRNGVRSIGTIYFDQDFRPGLTFHEAFWRDPESNGYVILEKLVELADYCGFDGYFLNQEEKGDDSEFKPFMAQLTARGLYTQWYDQNSFFDDAKAAWLRDDVHGQIHDSVFVNYEWSDDVEGSLARAERAGVDPYRELFFGVEGCMGKLSGDHQSMADLPMLYAPGTNSPRASVALFTPSDYYQMGLDEGLDVTRADGQPPLMQQEPYQWMVAERERMFFSGVGQDPRDTGKRPGFAAPAVGVRDGSGWVGVADFTPERSVIGGTDFSSTFNTGRGMGWFDDGELTHGQWTDIGAQSLLPSWQWWREGGNDEVTVDFDYGPELPRKDARGNDLGSPFSPVGAWRGGSSLVIHGSWTGDMSLRLFKTDLTVTGTSRLGLTYRCSAPDQAELWLELTFADAPADPVLLPVPGPAQTGRWETASLPLTGHEGRRIATVGLRLGEATAQQINVGEIALSSGACTPATPTGFAVQSTYDDGQLVSTWDQDPFDLVDYYLLEAIGGDGSGRHLFQGYSDMSYSRSSPTDGLVRYNLRAVGKDGSRSQPASVTQDFAGLPRHLRIDESPTISGLLTHASIPGQVDVSWDASPADPRRCRVAVELIGTTSGIDHGPFVVETLCSAGSATVPVSVSEGCTFDLSLTPEGAPFGLLARGTTHDSQVTPMPRGDFQLVDGSLIVGAPTTRDWWQIKVDFRPTGASDGELTELLTATRGDQSNAGLQRPRPLPSATGTVIVQLTDYSGNTGVQEIELVDL